MARWTLTTTGDSATLEFTVTEDDTAVALGSGDLPVLATPRLLAWCEAATCAAVEAALTDASRPASAPACSSSTSAPARSAPRSG